MKRVAKKGRRINRLKEVQEMTKEQMHFEEEMATIQSLIGLGMKAATERIQKDFTALVGKAYQRGKPAEPWGSNPGSIYLGDQKVAIEVPRARNRRTGEEMSLPSYERL